MAQIKTKKLAESVLVAIALTVVVWASLLLLTSCGSEPPKTRQNLVGDFAVCTDACNISKLICDTSARAYPDLKPKCERSAAACTQGCTVTVCEKAD